MHLLQIPRYPHKAFTMQFMSGGVNRCLQIISSLSPATVCEWLSTTIMRIPWFHTDTNTNTLPVIGNFYIITFSTASTNT